MVVWCAGAVAAADPTPPAQLVVTSTTPRPGTSSTVTFDAALDLDFNFGGMQRITKSKRSKKKKVEIVGVGADGSVEKRITYTKHDSEIVVDGQKQPDPTPVRGKTYRVTWKDGVVGVRAADGKPVSDAEAAAVREEESQLQTPELLGKALSTVRLVEGQPFEVPIAALEKMMSGPFRPKRLVLTYRGNVPDGARIDAVGTLANEAGGTKFYLDLKAELVIDTTGWCRSAKVTGQVRVELNGSVVGSGAGTGTITASPLR